MHRLTIHTIMPAFHRMGGGECVFMLDMHVMMMLWKKLAVNCDAIDPLTTIHNVTNGQLFSLDDIEPIMLRKS
jgi:ketopantoate reductase